MNFRAAITFLISLGSSSVPSFAEEFEMLSTSHFGYALERHSSTGFGQVGGSYLMFDLTTRSSNHLEFGLRSAAFGGQKHDVAFYRLGAGPLIGVKVRDNLQIQAAFLRFQESGHLKGHGHSYD